MNTKQARIFILCFLLLTVLSVMACAATDEPDEKGVMNIEFGENGMIRNGTEYYTYQVEKGKKGIVSVVITKVSGRLDIDICQVGSNDKQDYTGRDLDSASFDVIVDGPGEYQVCFTAKDFVGSYELRWSTEDNAEK